MYGTVFRRQNDGLIISTGISIDASVISFVFIEKILFEFIKYIQFSPPIFGNVIVHVSLVMFQRLAAKAETRSKKSGGKKTPTRDKRWQKNKKNQLISITRKTMSPITTLTKCQKWLNPPRVNNGVSNTSIRDTTAEELFWARKKTFISMMITLTTQAMLLIFCNKY